VNAIYESLIEMPKEKAVEILRNIPINVFLKEQTSKLGELFSTLGATKPET
jgi:hypothetical protein